MMCPDLFTLSQFVDGELDPAAGLQTHMDACPACARRVARVRSVERALTNVRRTDDAPTSPSRECLSPSQIVGWLDPTASAQERSAVEAHLGACAYCLGEALAAGHMTTRMASAAKHAVPAALRARVAAGWTEAVSAPTLATIVLRVVRAGAELLDHHLAAPFRELAELAAPLPATRAGTDVAALQFELRADGARIRTTVIPSGDAVGVTIVLADETGRPLPAQRVSLQRHGRAVFSARTDGDGQIAMPTLERGVYEVSCPGVAAAFRLDLRDAM